MTQQSSFEHFINKDSSPVQEAIKHWWTNYYDEGFHFSDIRSWEANFPLEKGDDIPVVSITLHMKHKTFGDSTFHKDFYS